MSCSMFLRTLFVVALLTLTTAQDCSTFEADEGWTPNCASSVTGFSTCYEIGTQALKSVADHLYAQRGDTVPSPGFKCRVPPSGTANLADPNSYNEVDILGSGSSTPDKMIAISTGNLANTWNTLTKNLSQTYQPGTKISFQYNFLSSEGFYIGTQYQDQGQVLADVCTTNDNGMAEVLSTFQVDDLADAPTSAAYDVICSGTKVVEYVLTKPAKQIVIRARNVADGNLDSILFVDNLGIADASCTPGAGGGDTSCPCNPDECTSGATCTQTNAAGDCTQYSIGSSTHKKVKLVIP